MAIIEKKSQPDYFTEIISGRKNFELRLNEFFITEGDTLRLREWDPKTKEYTGRTVDKKVTFVRRLTLDSLPWTEQEIKEKGLQIISIE